MNKLTTTALSSLLLGSLTAQVPDSFLFTTTGTETTLSGSSGTSLAAINPNEILFVSPGYPTCATFSAEKFAPRTALNTLTGDADGDGAYWEPGQFGAIDAIMLKPGFYEPTLRNTYFSPATDLLPVVSGGVGLRAGDVGAIVPDGQIDYFITAEQIQMALGMPITPITVNIDAISVDRQFGIFFSLEDNTPVGLCGATLVRDGDILMLPLTAFTYDSNFNVAAVVPNSAVIVYSEIQMNAFVTNAQVTNRFGVCQSLIIDTDAIYVDNSVIVGTVTWCGNTYPIPSILFAGQSLTGASVLDTIAGGRIHPGTCSQLGTTCGWGPTLGDQMGLLPTAATVGCPSSVNALALQRSCTFVLESPAPVGLAPSTMTIDVHAPAGATNVWLLAGLAPAAPGSVVASLPFWFGIGCFPDFFPVATLTMGSVPLDAQGFGTYTSPMIIAPVDVIWQGVWLSASGVMLSTPATTELY